ncbi:MAG: quinone-interacting membrane-bound oxidoreductase complex subunit QmoC [Deltaproteobacteria bacterium]|nr:quinone-interacting membrane-bound oxidoreductase complex subunit QmoC [Deltaproteobacteria bacterium]
MNSENIHNALIIDRTVRQRLKRLSGANASKCYQCATCSSVCDLSFGDNAFPRKQLQWAQLGLIDKIKSDYAIWLCHQCNDCSVHCPKDVRPGDIMAAMRALFISENSVIRTVGRMYERIGVFWPLTVFVPIVAWFSFFLATKGRTEFISSAVDFKFETLVPHWMIYSVNIPIFAGALIALGISGIRAWDAWGAPKATLSMKLTAFYMAILDIVLHRKMTDCTTAKQRSTGHFMIMWGFAGALVTTTVIAMLLFFSSFKLPLPFFHPLKIFGNIAGALILLGGIYVLQRRWSDSKKMGHSSAFDNYFVLLIFAVTTTGFGAQFARMANLQALALFVYLTHLGLVFSLFASLPFSKFSHMWYRLLAVTRLHLNSQEKPVRLPQPVSVND